jgi:hypothetical protein
MGWNGVMSSAGQSDSGSAGPPERAVNRWLTAVLIGALGALGGNLLSADLPGYHGAAVLLLLVLVVLALRLRWLPRQIPLFGYLSRGVLVLAVIATVPAGFAPRTLVGLGPGVGLPIAAVLTPVGLMFAAFAAVGTTGYFIAWRRQAGLYVNGFLVTQGTRLTSYGFNRAGCR